MKYIKILSMLAIALSVAGCATMFGSSSQKVNVKASNGQSFTAELSTGGQSFQVPGTIEVDKNGPDPVKIITNNANCSTVTEIDRNVGFLVWGNAISTTSSVLGAGADYVSGKMWNYNTNVIVHCRDNS